MLEPLLIFTTVQSNDFKFGTQRGFREQLTKTTFRTKIGGSWGQESNQINFGPLLISATVGLGEQRTNKQLFGPKQVGSELRGAPQKIGTSTSADIVANNFKLVHNLDLGRTSSKQLSGHKLAGFQAETPEFWNYYDGDGATMRYDTIYVFHVQ